MDVFRSGDIPEYIIKALDKMADIDTDNAKPMFYPDCTAPHTREDEAENNRISMGNAPAARDGMYVVPRTL